MHHFAGINAPPPAVTLHFGGGICSNIRDAVFSDSMASEYLIWYHRLHTYLKANKEVCDELEKETGIDHLADLFDVTGRGKFNDETTK